jgi:hypothetical protein
MPSQPAQLLGPLCDLQSPRPPTQTLDRTPTNPPVSLSSLCSWSRGSRRRHPRPLPSPPAPGPRTPLAPHPPSASPAPGRRPDAPPVGCRPDPTDHATTAGPLELAGPAPPLLRRPPHLCPLCERALPSALVVPLLPSCPWPPPVPEPPHLLLARPHARRPPRRAGPRPGRARAAPHRAALPVAPLGRARVRRLRRPPSAHGRSSPARGSPTPALAASCRRPVTAPMAAPALPPHGSAPAGPIPFWPWRTRPARAVGRPGQCPVPHCPLHCVTKKRLRLKIIIKI